MAVKIGSIVLLLLLFFGLVKLQTYQNRNLNIKQSEIEKILPLKLIIPKINVSAKVQLVGVTEGGLMDVPKSVDEVGLFSLGPLPGEIGSSVITGHYDDENGKQAVFYNLDKLVKGDKLIIENNDAIKTTFIVKEIKKYDEKYAEEIFSSNDMSHLNLVTCAGEWNKAVNSYSNRLVVFSDKLIEI